MPLGTYGAGLGPYWGVIQPVAKTNAWINPSWELGTAGAAGLNSLTVGSTSAYQAFGAWALWCAPSSANGTGGVQFGQTGYGSILTSQGSTYTASAYVLGTNGVNYMIAVSNTNGLNYVGSTTFTGGGTWHRHSVTFTEPSAGVPRAIIVKKNSDTTAASAGTFYVDGVQFEPGNLTTYIDGDQEGGTWLGIAQASASVRSGQVRAGGSIVALADLGLIIDEYPGIGMPPMQTNSQSYAVLDGDQFQRQRAAARPFTLTALIAGANQQDLHAKRRALIDALKIDATAQPQPTRFVYIGAGGTSFLDAVYHSGLEYGQPGGQFVEQVAIQFQAFDPYWRAERDIGTALAGTTNLGSVNYIAYRDPLGRWGTMGPNGSSVSDVVRAMAFVNDTLYAAGDFGSAAGTRARFIAKWIPQMDPTSSTFDVIRTWGTLNGGTIDSFVYAMAVNPGGTLYTGGLLTTAAGTRARGIAQYANAAWGTLGPGTLDHDVYALAYAPTGTLFVGGTFTVAAGTSSRYIAQYAGGWGSLTQSAGTLNEVVHALLPHPNGTLYVGGGFGSAAGTVARAVAHYTNGIWGTLGLGTWSSGASNPTVFTFARHPNGNVFAGGDVISISGGTVNDIARWNGAGWVQIGSGVGSANDSVQTMMIDPSGVMYVGGQIGSINRLVIPGNLAKYTGGAWLPLDIILPPTGAQGNAVLALARSADGTLYAGGGFAGTFAAAAVAQIVNPGMAQAYPTITIKNSGAGTMRLWQVLNTTTGDEIYFDLSMLSGETVTLNLTPAARSLTSDFRGSIVSALLPSSDFATWRLLPGTNYVSMLTDSGSMAASLVFRPRHWSGDGTI